jgi:hypothetical protein
MKFRTIALLIVTTSLIGCANTVYKTELEVYCPPLKSYSEEFNLKLADELESLPSSDVKIVEALSDYIALRDLIRECQKKRDEK